MNDTQTTILWTLAIGAGAFFGVRFLAREFAAIGAKANPANADNVINQGFQELVQFGDRLIDGEVSRSGITGEPLTFGERLFALVNPQDARNMGLIQ